MSGHSIGYSSLRRCYMETLNYADCHLDPSQHELSIISSPTSEKTRSMQVHSRSWKLPFVFSSAFQQRCICFRIEAPLRVVLLVDLLVRLLMQGIHHVVCSFVSLRFNCLPRVLVSHLIRSTIFPQLFLFQHCRSLHCSSGSRGSLAYS